MGEDWRTTVIALYQGLIADIEQSDNPESVLMDIERVAKDAREVLEKEING